MGRLIGKTALVSGGASGIGAAICEAFAREGCNVLVTDIQIERGRAVAEAIGERARFVRLDVTDVDQWHEAVGHADREFGGIDILVNNAGAAPSGVCKIGAEDPDSHRLTLAICASSVWYGTRAVVPSMRSRSGGSIINIASIDSFIGVAGFSSFVAAKHAVLGITKSTALELGSLGIRVNAIHPGIIDTPGVAALTEKTRAELAEAVSRQALKRLGTPGEVAKAAIFFASDDSAYCTASSLLIDGGHIAGRNRDLGY